MAAVEGDRFAFEVEWLDHNVGTKRKYQLMYYTANGTIEIPDLQVSDGVNEVALTMESLDKVEEPQKEVRDLLVQLSCL